MKAILLALAVATSSSNPVFASSFKTEYRVLPNLYADQYCRLRRMGVSREEAIDAAVSENMVPGSASSVTINGKIFSVDVIESVAAVERLCPAYLKQ